MKKIYLIVLIIILATGCTVGVIVSGNGARYDQSSPAATARSFLLAMQNGDSEAFGTLTRDVIPWNYMVSDLIRFATKNMSDSAISDYAYYQKGTALAAYNTSLTDSPQIDIYTNKDFFCMEFAMADGKYYIVDLKLPGSYCSSFTTDWYALCTEASENDFTRF